MHRKHIQRVLGGLLALGLLLPAGAAFAERVEIQATGLTVRAGPGTKHRRLGTAPKGSVYEVKGRKGSWVAIAFRAGKGWVFGRHVRVVTGGKPTTAPGAATASAPTAGTHTVMATRLNIRSIAGRTGKIRFRLNRGTRVSVKVTKGAWSRIEHRGRTGWTMTKFLTTGELPPAARRVRKRPRRLPKRPRRAPKRPRPAPRR